MSSLNSQILQEASEWLVDFTAEEPGANQRREFDAWLRRSPEHVRAYLELLPVWQQGATARFSRDEGPESLIAYALTEEGVVAFHRAAIAGHPAPAMRSSRKPLALAAVVAGVMIGAVWLWSAVFDGTTYTTGIGEQHSVALADGSTLLLNARSKVHTHFSGRERAVKLLEGQALFQVAPDPARPFIVGIGDTRVRAVGTQFDVSSKRKGTTITVVEGRVAVSFAPSSPALFLSAGEQVLVAPEPFQASAEPRAVDVAAVTAWTRRRLVFDGADLAEVVEEFNRYNAQQLVIRDVMLERFPISGTFSSTHPASLVRFLQAQPGIEVVTSRGEIGIRRR